MEEIKHKLNSNSVASAEAGLDRLHKAIEAKHAKGETTEDEIQILWDCCKSERPHIATKACRLIVILSMGGHFTPASALSGFLTIAPQVKQADGLVDSLGWLLTAPLQQGLAKSPINYGLATRQHPMVGLLRSYPTTWQQVLRHVTEVLDAIQSGKYDEDLALNYLKPILMFAFCDPHFHSHFSAFRQHLLSIVLSRKENPKIAEILKEILKWLPEIESSNGTEVWGIAEALMESIEEFDRDQKLLKLLEIVLGFTKAGLNPSIVTSKIKNVKPENFENSTLNSALIILAEIISESSSFHHESLISVAHSLMIGQGNSRISKNVSVFFALHLIPFQWENKKRRDEKVFELISMALTKTHENEDEISRIKLNTKTSVLLDCLLKLKDKTAQMNFLRALKETNPFCDSRTLKILFSLILATEDEIVQESVIKLLNDLISKIDFSSKKEGSKKVDSHFILSVLVFTLAQKHKTMRPENQLLLLKILPVLGKDKSCLSAVIQIMRSLAAKPFLQPIRTRLMYELWLTEDRIYPFLRQILEETPQLEDVKFARASVIRDICAGKSGAKHGADLLPFMNQTVKEQDETLCALALQGIASLVEQGIIDVMTTVKVLKPIFWNDFHRPKAFNGFLSIVKLVPTFKSNHEEFLTNKSALLEALWSRAFEQNLKTEVRASIFEAISRFPADDHTLKMFPAFVRESLQFPPGINPEEGSSPEDAWAFVPGGAWIQLITDSSNEELAELAFVVLRRLVIDEVEALPRGAFYLTPAMKARGEEPPNYQYLGERSILRAAAAFLKGIASGKIQQKSRKISTLVAQVFSVSDKTLPPLDWEFVQKLKIEADLCYEIVGRQSSGSRSAEILVHSAILSLSKKLERIRNTNAKLGKDEPVLLTLLDKIDSLLDCPDLFEDLKEFLSLGIPYVFNESLTGDAEKLTEKLSCLRKCLSKPPKPEDSEKVDYHEFLNGVFENVLKNQSKNCLEQNPKEFQDHFRVLLDIYSENATSNKIEQLTREESSQKADDNRNHLRLNLQLRCHLALKTEGAVENPLTWLNPILESYVGLWEAKVECEPFKSTLEVFNGCRNNETENRRWLLELMGRIRSIQRSLIEKKNFGSDSQNDCNNSETLEGLFDIFCLGLCSFAGCDVFLLPRLANCLSNGSSDDLALLLHECLPVALEEAFAKEAEIPWRNLAPQICEWLLQLLNDSSTGDERRKAIRNSLVAVKTSEKYAESSMWCKLVPL